MPPHSENKHSETFLRKRSYEIVVEKTEKATIFDQKSEERIPRFKLDGKGYHLFLATYIHTVVIPRVQDCRYSFSPLTTVYYSNVSSNHLTFVFLCTEISFGKVLGKGGFCTVSTLDDVTPLISATQDTMESSKMRFLSDENDFYSVTQDRRFICNNFIRNGRHRYALKKLSPELFDESDPQLFASGVIDLALEVKFLSMLRHPNIIKLRAIADMNSCAKNFFVVLDRLDMTLNEQINVWKKEKPSRFFAKQKREDFLALRLNVAYGISSALSYIHDNR